MKLLRILPLAFLLAAGLAACGKAKAKTEGEKLVDEMEANADAFCKCKKEDTACIEKVSTAGEAAEKKFEATFPDRSKIPADLQKRLDAGEAKVKACAANEAPPPTEGSGTGTGSAGISQEDQLLLDLGMVQTKVCGCTDKACVDKELEAAEVHVNKMKEIFPDESKVPAATLTTIATIKKSVEDCAAKIGAGEAPTAPPTAGGNDAAKAVIAEFHALKDEICKCADMACAEASMQKGEALEDKLKAALGDGDTPADIDQEMEKIEDEAEKCIEKLAPQ
jgi:hypothetical protein